jgi:serine/threonine protein kinase
MAPEQFQGDNSPACDIYALALVACEMLSGHPD